MNTRRPQQALRERVTLRPTANPVMMLSFDRGEVKGGVYRSYVDIRNDSPTETLKFKFQSVADPVTLVESIKFEKQGTHSLDISGTDITPTGAGSAEITVDPFVTKHIEIVSDTPFVQLVNTKTSSEYKVGQLDMIFTTSKDLEVLFANEHRFLINVATTGDGYSYREVTPLPDGETTVVDMVDPAFGYQLELKQTGGVDLDVTVDTLTGASYTTHEINDVNGDASVFVVELSNILSDVDIAITVA